MKEIVKAVKDEEERLQSLRCTTEATNETHLILKMNQTIQNSEIFGQIEVQNKLARLNCKIKKHKQARLENSNDNSR